MIDQNTYAIIALLAIVVSCYALHNSHGHWLLDLFGLALAFLAPRQAMAIAAVAIITTIRHSPLARGLASSVPIWALVVLLPGARDMSISDDESSAAEEHYQARISERETDHEKGDISRPVAEKTPKSIHLAQAEVLARLVISGEVGITAAIQIGAGAKSGKRYQKMSRLVRGEVERLTNHFPQNPQMDRFE